MSLLRTAKALSPSSTASALQSPAKSLDPVWERDMALQRFLKWVAFVGWFLTDLVVGMLYCTRAAWELDFRNCVEIVMGDGILATLGSCTTGLGVMLGICMGGFWVPLGVVTSVNVSRVGVIWCRKLVDGGVRTVDAGAGGGFHFVDGALSLSSFLSR